MSESSSAQHWLTQQRTARIVEIISVVIMSLTALLTAWSAYQATAWGTTMSIKFSQASTKRVLATRAETTAGQLTTLDVNLFTNWLNAYAENNTRLAQFYEERFRLEFQPAFQAWVATDPQNNADAPKSPFAMPEYQVSQAQEAERLDAEAAATYNEGLAANDKRDAYALTTVILASVLFFIGMSGRMKWFPLQVIMVTTGGVLLILAAFRIMALYFG